MSKIFTITTDHGTLKFDPESGRLTIENMVNRTSYCPVKVSASITLSEKEKNELSEELDLSLYSSDTW